MRKQNIVVSLINVTQFTYHYLPSNSHIRIYLVEILVFDNQIDRLENFMDFSL